jgi:hypothetical protein
MPRLTRLMMLFAVVVLVVSMTGPAWAKGSQLYFDRLYVAPGEEVVLETEFYTNVRGKSGSVDDGPYKGYLVPERRSIDPPHIPKRAIAIGPILIRPGGRDVVWSASIAFVIPRVDPGRYRVEICNVPCRHDMVGDLGGSTEFYVEASAEEARLKNLLNNWVEEMIQAWIPEADTSLRPQFDAYRVDDALRDSRTRFELTEQLEGLRVEMAVMRAEVLGRDEVGYEIGSGLWLAGWLVAAGIGGLWWVSSRRRRSSQGGQARQAPA